MRNVPAWLSTHRGLIGLLLFATVLRTGVVAGMFHRLRDDPDMYVEIGENLAQWGVYGRRFDREQQQLPIPTAYRPPLYPLLLSTLTNEVLEVSRLKIAVVHVLLGVGTVWLTWLIGWRFRLGSWSYLAAILVAADPILLNQSALVMTETLATFLAALALWCFARYTATPEVWKALIAGGAIGLATLCRPTFLPWLILAAVALLYFATNWRQRLAHVTSMVIGAAILLVPWGVRNQIEMGQFTVTTTHGGYTFHLGNNREAYAAMFLPDWYSWQVSQQIQFSVDWGYLNVPRKQLGTFAPIPTGWVTPPSEAKRSQNLYDHGFDEIRAAPHLFAYSCFFRLYQLFNPLPHPTADDESTAVCCARYAVAVWYLATYVLLIAGVCRCRWEWLRPPLLWGVLLVVAFMGVHTFYWTNLRMRAPLIPVLSLLAAAGAEPLAAKLASRFRTIRRPKA